MAAQQVAQTTTVLLAADPDEERDVLVQNLGPNPIFVEVGAPAVAATSVQVPATTGQLIVKLPPNTTLNAICPVALQVTPADTRIQAV